MPVLEVSFPAASLGDDYIQGEMTLTDSDGSVITLPARMKLRGATARQYTMKPSFNMKLENEEGEELDTDLLGLRKASSFILDAPFSAPLSQSSFRNALRDRWIATRQECFSVDSVASRMYGYCDLFESSGAWQRQCEYWDSKGSKPKYVSDLRAEIDLIVEWYAARHDEIDLYFDVNDDTSSLPELGTDSEDNSNTPIYDLRGFRVKESDLQPGTIYIRDGKKFLKL